MIREASYNEQHMHAPQMLSFLRSIAMKLPAPVLANLANRSSVLFLPAIGGAITALDNRLERHLSDTILSSIGTAADPIVNSWLAELRLMCMHAQGRSLREMPHLTHFDPCSCCMYCCERH